MDEWAAWVLKTKNGRSGRNKNQRQRAREENYKLMSTSTVAAALFSDIENKDEVCTEESDAEIGHLVKKENQVDSVEPGLAVVSRPS